MGILGLTHDENGSALEKLPVTIKVAIGEGPEPGKENGHPRKLDHSSSSGECSAGRTLFGKRRQISHRHTVRSRRS
jgi:hypothetical protein